MEKSRGTDLDGEITAPPLWLTTRCEGMRDVLCRRRGWGVAVDYKIREVRRASA